MCTRTLVKMARKREGYKVVDNQGRKLKVYDWDYSFSFQTGMQGEFFLALGAKDIGKTFGLRLKCIDEFISSGYRFVEVCRTKSEREDVMSGYFDKIQSDGFYSDYLFKTEKDCGWIAKRPVGDDLPDWQLCMYFVALSAFQVEKRRTFTDMRRFIFDEAIIDKKDKYHRYLPNEYFILANLLDSITREQPNDTPFYKVYLLGNSVDLTCPYLRFLGIDKVPKFGYTFYRNKTVLLHYIEPWDADDRRARTLVGRMLDGTSEAAVVFDNEFSISGDGEIAPKTPNAKYAYALKFSGNVFAVWIDYKNSLFYICPKIPKGAGNVLALTKSDNRIDYQAVKRTDQYMKMLVEVYYANGIRYSSPAIRECFLEVLGFLGVH